MQGPGEEDHDDQTKQVIASILLLYGAILLRAYPRP
jgi:hypothetical protein